MALVLMRMSVLGGRMCVRPLTVIGVGNSGVVLGRKGRMVKRRRVSFMTAATRELLRRW